MRVYLAGLATSAEEEAQLRKEAEREFRVVEGLRHEGVSQPLDLIQAERGPALLFDRVENEDRLDLWAPIGVPSLTLGSRIELVRQLADADDQPSVAERQVAAVGTVDAGRALPHKPGRPRRNLADDESAVRPRPRRERLPGGVDGDAEQTSLAVCSHLHSSDRRSHRAGGRDVLGHATGSDPDPQRAVGQGDQRRHVGDIRHQQARSGRRTRLRAPAARRQPNGQRGRGEASPSSPNSTTFEQSVPHALGIDPAARSASETSPIPMASWSQGAPWSADHPTGQLLGLR